MHRLQYIWCILDKKIAMQQYQQGDDNTNEIGIDNVIDKNNYGWFYEILNGVEN